MESMNGLLELNAWTKKDHFPMSFIDQMQDHIAGKSWH